VAVCILVSRILEDGDEGLDGAGASTLAQRLGSLLANGRFRVLCGELAPAEAGIAS
jgi:hypothetical protein